MQLKDRKKSVTALSFDEAMEIHLKIRISRLQAKEPKTQAKAKKIDTMIRETKARQEVLRDPAKIRELLLLLGED